MYTFETKPRLPALNRLRTRRVHSTLATLSCLLFLLASGPDVVLCFGDDGHVALETASPGKGCTPAPCPSSSTDASFAGTHLAPANIHPCGSCLDISLQGENQAAFHRPDRNRPAQDEKTPTCVFTSSLKSGAAPFSLALHPLPHHCSSSVTKSLRTTILRI